VPLPADASIYVPPNVQVGPEPLGFDPFCPAAGARCWRIGAIERDLLTLYPD
jgi:hypothetical protein